MLWSTVVSSQPSLQTVAAATVHKLSRGETTGFHNTRYCILLIYLCTTCMYMLHDHWSHGTSPPWPNIFSHTVVISCRGNCTLSSQDDNCIERMKTIILPVIFTIQLWICKDIPYAFNPFIFFIRWCCRHPINCVFALNHLALAVSLTRLDEVCWCGVQLETVWLVAVLNFSNLYQMNSSYAREIQSLL